VNTITVPQEQIEAAFRLLNPFQGDTIVPNEKVAIRFVNGDEDGNYFLILHPEDWYTMLSIGAKTNSMWECGAIFPNKIGIKI
ncbi:MAG TPA: hypothetical protein PLS49_03525, partial [Candidatus Woesebacteria bacterium]|nr:hypothetical protein [Candidatus Woesebacteria bacterium]